MSGTVTLTKEAPGGNGVLIKMYDVTLASTAATIATGLTRCYYMHCNSNTANAISCTFSSGTVTMSGTGTDTGKLIVIGI